MDIITYVTEVGGTGKRDCKVIQKIAKRAECSPGTLYMICRGHKQAGPLLAVAIEDATKGAVTRNELRPDIFGPGPSNAAA